MCHTRFIELQATTAQQATQPFPNGRIGQQILQMQQQKSAVRPQQAACPDLREVGHQLTALRRVLDTAKQVSEHRVVLHDDGRTLTRMVVHHHIHPTPRQHLFQRVPARGFIIARGQQVVLAQHALQHLRQVIVQPGAAFRRQTQLLAQTGQALCQYRP